MIHMGVARGSLGGSVESPFQNDLSASERYSQMIDRLIDRELEA